MKDWGLERRIYKSATTREIFKLGSDEKPGIDHWVIILYSGSAYLSRTGTVNVEPYFLVSHHSNVVQVKKNGYTPD